MLKAVIFDDEYIVLKGLERMIDWAEYGIELVGTATDGEQGLALFHEKQPDLVFSDIRMPGMDGLQVIEEIRKVSPETLCIVFSGFNEFEYVKKALKIGVMDYLEKPITIPVFKETLAKVMLRVEELEEIELLKSRADRESIPTELRSSNLKHEAVKKACVYIKEHYTKDLTLQEVSDFVGMNPTYFSLLFKEEMGKSYIKYITYLRMEKAKQLLKQGCKVAEVSEKVGYHSYRHFTDLFKKHVGQSPGQYRE